jgi:abequosyltransferase
MRLSPLLTIAIPTWNRDVYLEQNLRQLRAEMAGVPADSVEILVSDNASSDRTSSVVEEVKLAGLHVTYVRNQTNIGWGANFAQCFSLANGKYVLILGDDDLLVDGTLALLVDRLSKAEYGVLCMRPYGFDDDFRREYPGRYGNETVFRDGGDFLCAIGALMTLISSCVVNKNLLSDVDARKFSDSDLMLLHLVVRAALLGKEHLFVNRYLVASKRNNSSNYCFSDVFVRQMWGILDSYVPLGLNQEAIRSLEARLLFSYYPFYLLSMRAANSGDLGIMLRHFGERFGHRRLFSYWIAPILWLPRPLAIAWGTMTVCVGRVVDGDLRRGLAFAGYRIARTLRK